MMHVNPLIVCREEFDGSGCLFNPDDGKVFGLNRTSVAIWRALEAGQPDEAGVMAALRQCCDGNLPESAGREVESFLNELREKGYLSND